MGKSTASKSGESKSSQDGADAAKSPYSRNMKVFVGAGALALILGGVIVASRPPAVASQGATPATAVAAAATESPGAQGTTGSLTAMQKKFNFKSISMANGKVTHRYPIRNTGTEPIVVSKMYTSCMCTTVALVKDGKATEAFGMPGHTPIPTVNIPIGPRDQAFVEVVFDPAAHGPAGVGPIERVVTLENSTGQPFELSFAALVTP